MFSAAEIVDLAVQIERNGENVCRELAGKTVDPELKLLLEWMAEQEAQHILWFSDLRRTIRTEGDFSRLEQFGKALLGDILGDQSFSLRDAEFSNIQSIKKLLSLLTEFEQDTILFYEMLRTALTDKSTLSLLDKIIDEENRHIAQVRNYFNKHIKE